MTSQDIYEENKRLRDRISILETDIKRAPLYIIAAGIFIFIPIGMVLGHYILNN